MGWVWVALAAALVIALQARIAQAQRRDVIRLLSEEVAVEHKMATRGPRVDLSRLRLIWRS